MATRQETQNKKRLMRESIVEACRSGQMQEGDSLPPVKELARQYGLSINLACDVIQGLVVERVLHARPGAGTIVGSPRLSNRGTYLFLLPERTRRDSISSTYLGQTLRGFEEAIAELGSACLTLEIEQACQYAISGELPSLAGVFSIDPAALSQLLPNISVPTVYFGDPLSSHSLASGLSQSTLPVDSVRFDDRKGGKQATQHLLSSGHKSIAFLALHASEKPHDYKWSAEREAGWREEMQSAGERCENLAFHPLQTPSLRPLKAGGHHVDGIEQIEAAREAIQPLIPLIERREITAVIAANLFAARALFAVLDEVGIAPSLWPAVVCFDGMDGLDNHVVSALSLTWAKVGGAAAQLLWERNVERLRGNSTERLVQMQLIPRLTCSPDWTISASLIGPPMDGMSLTTPAQALAPVPTLV